MVKHLVSEKSWWPRNMFGSVKMQRPALGDFDLENGKLKSAAQMQSIRMKDGARRHCGFVRCSLGVCGHWFRAHDEVAKPAMNNPWERLCQQVRSIAFGGDMLH